MVELKNKDILITGATGFVGANIVRKSLDLGANVHIITRESSDKWRINDLLKDLNAYNVDLLEHEKLIQIVSKIEPSIIFHLATYGGSPFQKDSNLIIKSNFIGTFNLVNACKKADFELFVNTSSSSEYGIKSGPMEENDMLEPANDYGVSKAASTLYCQSIARREELPIVTLRLFSPYGYYESPTRLIPSVIMACLKNENPKVTSPHYVRDFIFIDDVIDSYIKTAEKVKFRGDIFNIGQGIQHSIGEVVNKIIEMTGNKVDAKWGSESKWLNEPEIWQANITKANKILKWKPKFSLEQGLSKTIKWFEKNSQLYKL
ncbi:MAG: NAD-dependent epimerase/dehydratase family protein [Methanobacterium sp.]|uniref:NAD-dependent epimerase/dehydratase family protein n=1 Tax=Methanobacterium sp. TaxID=2164 RepID=UPI003D64C086|nr:NAD-dependent epimerase/dehydratase family protein [Methanobacterium sp.]